jgi:hypothetical protein
MKSSYTYKDGSVKFENVVMHGRYLLYIGDISEIPKIHKFPIGYAVLPIKSISNIPDRIDRTVECACFGDNPWYGNIAHAIFDGLYPMFLSMVKFAEHHKDFLYITHSWTNRNVMATEVVNTFSGNELLNIDDVKDEYIFCKTLFSGSGEGVSKAGNCVINKKYKCYGQEEYNAFSLFKSRMFSKFNLTLNKPINNRLKIIVIDNRRFSASEHETLHNLVRTFQNTFDIKYVNWRNYESFAKQMEEYQDVDIQITGPGTGMLYAPFLKTGAVNVNLGHMETTDQRKNLPLQNPLTKNHTFPAFMEQPICASADYVNTIFYDRYNSNILDLEVLSKLLLDAASLVGSKQLSNISKDALVFKEYLNKCDHAEKISNHLTNLSIFGEFFVNEHPSAIPPYVNLDLLRSIKKQLGYGNKYSILMNGI